MAKAVRIEENSFQRIAQVTRHVERANRGTTGPSPPVPTANQFPWYAFINNYAGEIPAYGVVEIEDVEAYDHTIGGIFSVTRPGTTFKRYALNGPNPVPQNGSGYLRFSGEAIGAYDTGGSPAIREGWGVKPDSFLLWKGHPSLVTVHKIVDSTNSLLLGTLGEIRTLLCKATADLTAGAVSSNFQIWSGTMASGANAGFSTLPTIELKHDIADDDFFFAHWMNNGWMSESSSEGECPA